jgi:hypothetical protein
MRRLLILSSCLLVLATAAGAARFHRPAEPPSPLYKHAIFSEMTVLDVVLPDANGQNSGAPGVITITPDAGFHMEVPGDTLAYNISWGAGARATGYAVTVNATPSTGWLNLPQGFQQTGTVFLLRAVNTTQPDVNFTVTVCSKKGTTVYTNKCAVASWAVTRQPGPPGLPVIDSSMTIVGLRDWELLPEGVAVWRSLTAQEWKSWDSASVAAGAPQGYRDSVHTSYAMHAQVQFCSIGYFTDNSRYPLGPFPVPADSAYCVNQVFTKYPGWGSSPNARSIARNICPQYTATGGTITNSTDCISQPPQPMPTGTSEI